jgi:poly-gamma-glutamate capsule biosynthesis protein CapA/YwtB (metallophosphatase superfamily)
VPDEHDHDYRQPGFDQAGYPAPGRDGREYPRADDRGRGGYPGADDRGRSGYPDAGDRSRSGYPGAGDRGRGGYPGADDSGRSGYPDAGDRGRRSYAERGGRGPDYPAAGDYEPFFADARPAWPGSPERWAPEADPAEPPSGAGRRRTNNGRRGRTLWGSRNRLVLMVGVAVAVIGLGSWQLMAARAGDHGGSGSPLAAGKSPTAGPSGAHSSGRTSPSAASSATVTLDWVGDMTFGAPGAWPPSGTGSLFDAVTGYLQSDLTMGNLESALGDLPMSKCAAGETDCYEFEAPDSTAQVLKQHGFSAVNVANNHTLDAGTAGEANTNSVLQQSGLAYAGRPGQITYLTRNGITIALLGFAPWSYDADALDIPAAEALVRQAKQHAQVVIVMEHLGAEGDDAQHVTDSEEYYLGQDRGNSIAFTHGVIDAGADLVVGSGPHVLRGFQWYHGHLIAYSLGNFCGYNTLGLDSITSVSAVLHVTLGAQGQFVSGSITPLRLVEPGTPEPDPSGSAIGMINSLSQDDFGGNGAAVISAAGIISPPTAG